MHTSEHKQRILKTLKEQGNDLYSLAPRIVESIVEEVNRALDAGFEKSEDPDEMLRHRERMHHLEGIEQVTEELTRNYGEIYKELIRQIATQHVRDDMNQVPRREDYQRPGFWKNWSSQNETLCSWL